MNDFINKNKNLTWSLPKTDLSNPVEFTEWLVRQESLGWIELNLEIDVHLWKKEAASIEEFFVDHRSHQGHTGWQGCSIHGQSHNRTETVDDVEFDWTELAALTPSITDFWKSVFPVQGYKRLRFMKLAPGGIINIHNDLPDGAAFDDIDPLRQTLSVNLAITHPSDCDMIVEGCGTVPWSEGRCFIINITKNHCVVNNSSLPRIHMIAECLVGDRLLDFSNLLYNSYQRMISD
jgi:Aspartyl/Asparaginyl beta-hydroxylase